MAIEQWVKDIAESEMGPAPFAIGDTVQHPEGYAVTVVSGQYWAEGGFSNWWSWRRVDENGVPFGPVDSGYGWRSEDPPASLGMRN